MNPTLSLADIPRPAWIAIMILGFIAFWPIGLMVLAYLFWSGKMRISRDQNWPSWSDKRSGFMSGSENGGCRSRGFRGSSFRGSTGNMAFDKYRDEMLNKLEAEIKGFQEHLDRLRFAKDQDEFDRYMRERQQMANEPKPAA